MLFKCCNQYNSKFGKSSSDHRTGKGQFSFQSQRKAVSKNAQTTTQLHSYHTLVKSRSKVSKSGFSNTWTMNFQMFKLVLGKDRNQRSNIHWIMEKAREFQKNIYFCFIDYANAVDYVDYNKLWRILKEMGIPDHLTCLLRNIYAGQEATVRTGHGTTDWFQIEKGVRQGCILSPCLFNLYAEYIMRNSGLEEAQADSRLPGEISVISDMQMTAPLWQKVKRN